MQDYGCLAVFKVTARDQGHYKGPSGAFVTCTYCNISGSFSFLCALIRGVFDDKFSYFSSNPYVVTHMYIGHNICFHAELTKIIPTYHQIFPFI